MNKGMKEKRDCTSFPTCFLDLRDCKKSFVGAGWDGKKRSFGGCYKNEEEQKEE